MGDGSDDICQQVPRPRPPPLRFPLRGGRGTILDNIEISSSLATSRTRYPDNTLQFCCWELVCCPCPRARRVVGGGVDVLACWSGLAQTALNVDGPPRSFPFADHFFPRASSRVFSFRLL